MYPAKVSNDARKPLLLGIGETDKKRWSVSKKSREIPQAVDAQRDCARNNMSIAKKLRATSDGFAVLPT